MEKSQQFYIVYKYYHGNLFNIRAYGLLIYMIKSHYEKSAFKKEVTKWAKRLRSHSLAQP